MKVEMLIREIRKSKGISLSELSKKSGISKPTLSNIERNMKEPKLTTAIRIAKALEVNVENLYKYKE